MNGNSWQRVKLIFERALELRSEDRLAYISQECGGDSALEMEVISLLRADANASGFLTQMQSQDVRLGGRTMTREAGQFGAPGRSDVGGWVGQYQLVDFIASGGMGAVYRAVHGQTGRVVALKMLHETIDDADITRRLLNEAQVLSRLNHPGIATLYELLDSRGRPCLVMEYVDGLTIAQQMKVSGPIPADQAIYVIKKLAGAVGYLHSNGVLHRDIKAENIKIQSSGEIKLLDFGLAQGQFATRLTRVGGVMGTLPYMSPELLQMGTPDTRSDVWALGVLLYEMVIGVVPFPAESTRELYAQQTARKQTPPSALRSGVSKTVDVIVKGCLEVKPERRYQTGSEIADAIRQSSRTLPPTLSRKTRLSLGAGSLVSSNWRYLLAVIPLVMLGILLFQYLAPSDAPNMPEMPPENTNRSGELTDGPAGPGVALPAAHPPRREPDANIATCSSRPPSDLQGSVTLTLESLGSELELYSNGRRIGATPCFIQGPVDSSVNIETRLSNGARGPTETFNFLNDHTYTISGP